jgi:hypothetical protein
MWGSPSANGLIGDVEASVVAYCIKPNNSARQICQWQPILLECLFQLDHRTRLLPEYYYIDDRMQLQYAL